MITLDRVSARGVPRKGEVRAELRGASVTLDAGITVLVGARASGGPLVLDLVSGRVRPRTGSVTVLGKIAGNADLAREIAYVPTSAELPAGLTVNECVRLSLAVRSSLPRSADASLERLGIAKLGARRTDTLSPGEQRAVLLSMALAARPRVLLMEEPCNWFDPRALSKIEEALRSIASEGSAVLLATQSALDATRLGGRHLRVMNGAIEEGLAEPPFSGLRIKCARAEELAAALAHLVSSDSAAPRDVSESRDTGGARRSGASIKLSREGVVLRSPDARSLLAEVGRVIANGAFDITSMEKLRDGNARSGGSS